MAGNIGKIKIGLGLNLTGLRKDLNRSAYMLKRQAAKFKQIGSAMSSAITLPLAGIGIAGAKLAVDLETNFGKINNLVGASSEELKKYKSGVSDISSATSKSQSELSDALFDLTSAGLKGDAALAALQSSAKASAIGLGETKVVASAVSSAMNAYEKSNLGAARATDILAATVKFGKTEAESLAPAIGQVLPIASALGVTFEEVGANIATFTRIGIDSKQAATALKSLLSGLSGAAGADQAAALESVGLSMQGIRDKIKQDGLLAAMEQLNESTGGNVETLSRIIPNVRAFSNVLGTVGAQGDTYREALDGITNSTGLVGDGFENVTKTAGFQFNALINQIKNTGISIGQILLPSLLKVAGIVSSLVGKFQALTSEQKNSVIKITAIIAAIGPGLFLIGKLIGGFSLLTTIIGSAIGVISTFFAALFSPIGLVVAALVFVVGALINNWESVRTVITKVINRIIELYNESVFVRIVVQSLIGAFKSIFTILKGIFNIFTSIGGVLKSIFLGDFDSIGQLISDGLEQVKQDALGIGEGIGENLAEGLANVITPKKLLPITEADVDSALKPMKDGILGIIDKGKEVVETIKNIGGVGVSSGKDYDSSASSQVARGLITAPAALGSVIAPTIKAPLNLQENITKAKEAVIELGDAISGTLVESMTLLGESFGSILSGTVSFSDGIKNIGKGLLTILAGVLEQVGKSIIAAGLAMDALKKTLNFGNPFTAIAAGIGLIAVAKIAKSSIANSVPKLASGGVLTSEQLFIGGEYSGASNNPEIVTPQNIMAETFRKVLGQSGGGSGVGVLHMDTIRFGLEKDNLRVT